MAYYKIYVCNSCLYYSRIHFKNIIFDKILFAIKNPDFLTYKIICKVSGFLGLAIISVFKIYHFNLINISMSGQFSAHITTSLIVGIIISFPYFVWEMWRFIKPALHKNEKIKVRGVVFFITFIFYWSFIWIFCCKSIIN